MTELTEEELGILRKEADWAFTKMKTREENKEMFDDIRRIFEQGDTIRMFLENVDKEE